MTAPVLGRRFIGNTIVTLTACQTNLFQITKRLSNFSSIFLGTDGLDFFWGVLVGLCEPCL